MIGKISFRRYLIAGLLVWLPLWVTFLVVRFLIQLMDESLSLLPAAYQPENLLGFHIPGLGVLVTLLLLLLTGLLVANFIGSRLVNFWESLLAKIPLVRSIHTGVKQVLNTLLSSSGQSFRQVLLVEYPRKGSWTIAFLTNEHFSVAEEKLNKPSMTTVFVPTTPNPTSGFLVIIPTDELIYLDISVDEALKMVISLGTVLPEKINTKQVKKNNE